MKMNILCRRYASAFLYRADDSLYESLLSEQKKLFSIFKDNEDIIKLLKSKFVNHKTKESILHLLIDGIDNKDLWKGLFNTILQKKRESFILGILEEIEKMLLIKLNKVKIRLLLAREHQQKTINNIKHRFEKLLAKHVILETEIHPEIIGGFIAMVGNTRIDGSIIHSLENYQKLKIDETIQATV